MKQHLWHDSWSVVSSPASTLTSIVSRRLRRGMLSGVILMLASSVHMEMARSSNDRSSVRRKS